MNKKKLLELFVCRRDVEVVLAHCRLRIAYVQCVRGAGGREEARGRWKAQWLIVNSGQTIRNEVVCTEAWSYNGCDRRGNLRERERGRQD